MVDASALRSDEGRGKLRKASGSGTHALYPKMSEWGNPPVYLVRPGEYIASPSERGEVKHLSTLRKRNQLRFS